jgi:hypothetical protein
MTEWGKKGDWGRRHSGGIRGTRGAVASGVEVGILRGMMRWMSPILPFRL